MKNKFTTTVSSLTIIGLMAAAPLAAFAKEGDTKREKSNGANFCTIINSEDFKALTKYEDRADKFDDKRDERDGKINEHRDLVDQKREDHKSEFEDKQSERSGKFEAKGLTDEQKKALTAAQQAVQNAIDNHSGDISALVKEFRNNMDQIRSEHRTAIDGLLVGVKADVDAAITKAKADCAAGVAPETVKTNFQESVKASHEKFVAERKDVQDETKADIKAEVEAKKDGRESITLSFRTSIKSAWESFKALFGKK